MSDMKSPENGRRNTAVPIPPAMLPMKQTKIARLKMVMTPVQFRRPSIHDPMNLPIARRMKKLDIAYEAMKVQSHRR
jgi:hypothetical protein